MGPARNVATLAHDDLSRMRSRRRALGRRRRRRVQQPRHAARLRRAAGGAAVGERDRRRQRLSGRLGRRRRRPPGRASSARRATAASPTAATWASPAGAAEFVLLLNPDARLDAASLAALVRRARAPIRSSAAPARARSTSPAGCVWSQRRFPRLRSTYAQALFLQRAAPHASWSRRGDPRSRRLRAPRLAGLALGRLPPAPPRGARGRRRPGRGLLPLLRGDRPVPAAARGGLGRRATSRRATAHHAGRRLGAAPHDGADPGAAAASATRASTTARSSRSLEAAGLALGALTHAAVWIHRPRCARGHARRRARRARRAVPLGGRTDEHRSATPSSRPRATSATTCRALAESIVAQDHRPALVDHRRRRLRRRHGRRRRASSRGAHDWIVVVGTGEDADELARGPPPRPRPAGLPARPAARSPRRSTSSSRSTPTRRSSPTTSTRLLAALRRPARPRDRRAAAATSSWTARWERIKVAGSHPRGASRAYRWELLDDVVRARARAGLGRRRRGHGRAARLPHRRASRTSASATTARSASARAACARASRSAARPGTWATARATWCCARSTGRGRTRRRSRWSGATRRGGHRRTAVPAPDGDRPDPRGPAPARRHAPGPMDIRPEV